MLPSFIEDYRCIHYKRYCILYIPQHIFNIEQNHWFPNFFWQKRESYIFRFCRKRVTPKLVYYHFAVNRFFFFL
jgi:hypothetical protein